MHFFKLVVALGGLALAAAAPKDIKYVESTLAERDASAFSLAGGVVKSLIGGLTRADAEHMAKIGMAFQGENAKSKAAGIWLGGNGANTFKFKNSAGKRATLILWNAPPGDFQSSFVNVRRAKITYSMKAGAEVTVSLNNGVSGAWAVLYDGKTKLTQFGQVDETWGEFTTGNFATVDVSSEVNAKGTPMMIKVKKSGCVSDANRCSFHCKSGNTCGASGSYTLKNCAAGSQPGASIGFPDGINPEGGCQGWSNGGHLDVTLGK
ncbi:hypothetical protein F5Y04DRAFT_291312 [Hypomontagnella monticulosa]|nr:hypothetical protein F5Y04DRAFT_291312 [Hypomontagnella monticulosa]